MSPLRVLIHRLPAGKILVAVCAPDQSVRIESLKCEIESSTEPKSHVQSCEKYRVYN